LTYATHMHLIAHGRTICTARSPRCGECPLLDLCPEGRRRA
jgi:endonuclease-3